MTQVISPRRLPAVAALCVAGIATLAFAMLAWSALLGGGMDRLDEAVACWVGARATPVGTAFLSTVSHLHGPRVIAAGTFMVMLFLWFWRSRDEALMLLVVVFGGASINHLLKHGFRRPRPGEDVALAASSDFGFPSGHVANAVLLYGSLAVLLAGSGAPRGVRLVAILGAALMVSLVGLSRIGLGAHRFSDVLGGALVGIAWLALCSGAWWLWREARIRPAAPGPMA